MDSGGLTTNDLKKAKKCIFLMDSGGLTPNDLKKAKKCTFPHGQWGFNTQLVELELFMAKSWMVDDLHSPVAVEVKDGGMVVK